MDTQELLHRLLGKMEENQAKADDYQSKADENQAK
jgi:hypothetical protein